MNLSFLSNDQHQIMKTLLVSLLRLSWIAATLPIIIASIPIPKLNFLRQILLGFAKRGKTSSSSQVTPLSHSFIAYLSTLFIFIHFHFENVQIYHLFINVFVGVLSSKKMCM